MKNSHSLKLCVLTTWLQGDYMGEIINQIRMICATRNFQLSVIRTNSFGLFDYGIGLDNYDGIIVIRNAVSTNLIKEIKEKNIPIVSIAFDYFPLDVPVISCDNNAGMDLAFDYLLERNHKDIAFIGDLTQYDLRKRYERFCDLHKKYNLALSDDNLIFIQDSLFSGGIDGTKKFLNHKKNFTSVIVGAGQAAIGFVKSMQEESPNTFEGIDIVGFDNVPAMKIMTPTLPRIDQNLDTLSLRSVDTLEALIKGESVSNSTTKVAPTLCLPDPNNTDRQNIPNEVCVTGLDTLDYANTVIQDSYESIHNIVDSRLATLMSVSPLFSQYMEFGLLSRIEFTADDTCELHTDKIFQHNETLKIEKDNQAYHCKLEDFPPKIVHQYYDALPDTCAHFPIHLTGELWGILSLFGKKTQGGLPETCNFNGFTTYMDMITYGYSMTLEIDQMRGSAKSDKAHSSSELMNFDKFKARDDIAHFEWDLERGTVRWNELALRQLGFKSEFDQDIYRNMEIFDRIHEEDEQRLRHELTNSLSNLKTMETRVRIRNANGEYGPYKLHGEIIHEEENRAIHYVCNISLDDT